jgi:hypothetical protein
MTASSGKAALGALFVWYNRPVAELTNMMGPASDSTEVEITNHDTEYGYKEFVPSFLESGAFDVEGNFIPTDSVGQQQLITDHYARQVRAAFIHFPGSASFSFDAYFKSFQIGAPVGDKLSFKGTLRITGKPTVLTTAATGLTTPFFALKDNGGNAVTPSPAAAAAVYVYTAALDAGDTTIAVQPTATTGTIYVNGTAVTTGNWSSGIAVAAGGSKLLVIEVREANKASKVYRVWVTRPSA